MRDGEAPGVPADVVEAYEVARELRPPPMAEEGRALRWYEAALACVRAVAAERGT